MVVGGEVNWKRPGEISEAGPATVQLASDKDRLVEERTVKVAPGLLVKANCITPLPSICALAKLGGVTPDCVIGMD